MAITENSFTDQEFISALETNPALTSVVKTALGSKKFVVQDEAEHKTWLENYQNTDFTKKVKDQYTSELATRTEKEIFETSGIERQPNEKWYEFNKRVIKTLKENGESNKTELEKLKAGHHPSEADKTRIAQLEKAIADGNKELQDKYEASQNELSTVKKAFVADTAFAKIRSKYKPGLPETLVKMTEDAVRGQLIKDIRTDDKGVNYVVDAEGKMVVGSNQLPLSVDDVLLQRLGDMVDTGRKAEGSGTNKDDINDKGNGGKFTGVPADVKTRVQLREYLQKIGMTDTKEMDKILEENKNLPLR